MSARVRPTHSAGTPAYHGEPRDGWDRLIDWLWQGRWLNLLRGLPALAAALALIALAVAVAVQPLEKRRSFYDRIGTQAFARRDYATAALAYERLALSANIPELRFRWAIAADKLGETALVDSLLETLAPDDALGFLPAHTWRARRLLAGPKDRPRLELAETHLRRVLEVEPEHVEALALRGRVCLALQRPTEALTLLARAAPAKPELELLLAKLYATQGRFQQAVAHAERARDHYRPLAESAVDDPQPRLNWAEATLLTGEAAAAVSILKDGMNRKPDPAYLPALARAYLAWSDVLERQKPAELGTRLELLEQALRHDALNFEALSRLIKLSRGEGAERERAKALLQRQLAEGKAAGTIHLLLGMQAREQDKNVEALRHFEQAYRLKPDLAGVANNLAWALAHTEPPDLPRALNVIDSVVERFPKVASFRETRGQILAKLGRWPDAVADLEFALPQMPKNAALHATLGQAYRRLDLPDLAREHERLATPQAHSSQESRKHEKRKHEKSPE